MVLGGIVKGGFIGLLLAAAFVLLAAVPTSRADASLATARPDDPVVLKGSGAIRLIGAAPGRK